MAPRLKHACFAVPGLLLALLSGTASAYGPEANYMIHCMGCHLPGGVGSPPEVPDSRGEIGKMLAVPGGREYLVQVPGAAHSPLSDQELAEVINYMLLTFSRDTVPADFVPYTGEEVARYRKILQVDVKAVREVLLERLETLADDSPATQGAGVE